MKMIFSLSFIFILFYFININFILKKFLLNFKINNLNKKIKLNLKYFCFFLFIFFVIIDKKLLIFLIILILKLKFINNFIKKFKYFFIH